MTDLVFSTSQDSGQYYARATCKEAYELKQHLQALYGLESAEQVDLAPSGLSAISTVFHTLSLLSIVQSTDPSRGLIIIYDQELYCDTMPLLSLIQSLYRPYIQLVQTDCTNMTTLRKEIHSQHTAHPGHTLVVFAESCSNPSGRLFAFEHIARLKKDVEDATLYVVIDNTWTTALGINPFHHGADVVVESCTKYLSGCRVLGGVVLSTVPHLIAESQRWRAINGVHVSIANTRVILDAIHELQQRVHTASKNCMELMKALAAKGVELTHPLVGNHPARARNKKAGLLQCAPPIFVARIAPLSKQQLKGRVCAMQHVEWKTSYGAAKCHIDTYPVIHDNYTEIRIAAGYDDVDVAAVVEELQSLL